MPIPQLLEGRKPAAHEFTPLPIQDLSSDKESASAKVMPGIQRQVSLNSGQLCRAVPRAPHGVG